MQYKVFLLSLMCLFLTACSSKPSEITYYQLNDSIEKLATKPVNSSVKKQYVQLANIKVPDYLKQSKLVLRTAPFEMHFAASHLWVQTPEKEIRAALLSELNNKSEEFWFINVDPTLSGNITSKLVVEITHFYPTENAEVILLGNWTLVTGPERVHHQFQLNADLQADGYAHSVAQQRHLISVLAREIAAQMHGN